MHHNKSATAELAKILTGEKSTLILIQEPYRFRGMIKGLGVTGGRIIRPHLSEEKPRACIWASKDLKILPLAQFNKKDVTALILTTKVSTNKIKMIVGSIYVSHTLDPPYQDIERLSHFARKCNLPLLIGGDVNAHHRLWGSTDTNKRGENLLELIATTDLEILNKGREATFVTKARREVLDITLASNRILDYCREWRVTSDITLSDHRMVTLKIDTKTPPSPLKRNPRNTDWKIFRDKLESLTSQCDERLSTRAQLEREAGVLEATIVGAFEDACPLRTGPKRRIRWWTKELTRLQKSTRKAFNKAYKTKKECDWKTYRDASNTYKKEIRKQKRESWRQFCSNVEKNA